MDAKLPDLRTAGAQLAGDIARVQTLLGQLPGYLNRLVEAADRRDWPRINALSQALADGSRIAGIHELSGAAEQLASASWTASNPSTIRRALLRLIGVGGRTRRQVRG